MTMDGEESAMDDRVEAFLREVLRLEGETQAQVRENVRFHIAECEKMFRDAEPDERTKDQAAQRSRLLCRERAVQELARSKGTPTEGYLGIVLEVIDSPARFRM